MKKIFLLLSFILFTVSCFAQTDTTNKKNNADDNIFNEVQEPAEFPGGIQGWIKYLQDSLNAGLASDYIILPKGKKVAKVTVVLSFIIDKKGAVSDVHAEKTIPDSTHPVFIKEAIRVIEKGPKWIPAKQNGKLVLFRHRQSITWQATEE